MNSIIDKIYEEIFGESPTKAGAAYERISAIAMYMLEQGEVRHDARMRGKLSQTLYQLDVEHTARDGKTTMGEVKDFTLADEKVGRGEIQKLAGALPDLEGVARAAFFSATGYTQPARKYAKAASAITGGKEIDLYELSLATEKDDAGRIKAVVLRIHFQIQQDDRVRLRPILTDAGQRIAIEKLVPPDSGRYEMRIKLGEFFDSSGKPINRISDITAAGYGEINDTDNTAYGCYWLPGHYIRITGVLLPISGVSYEIPYETQSWQLQITDDSKYRFILKDDGGKILKTISDTDLQEFSFDSEGNLIPT